MVATTITAATNTATTAEAAAAATATKSADPSSSPPPSSPEGNVPAWAPTFGLIHPTTGLPQHKPRHPPSSAPPPPPSEMPSSSPGPTYRSSLRLLIPRPRSHLHLPPRLLPLSAPAPTNASLPPHPLCWPLRLSPISPPGSALHSPPRRRASPSRAGGPIVFPPSTLASFAGRLPLYHSSSRSSPSPQNPRLHQQGRLCGVVLPISTSGLKTFAAETRLAGDLSHHLFKI